MNSMTAYGYAEATDQKARISLELKSWNNRYLDIGINLPPFLSSLEQEYRKRIQKMVSRGKVELTIRIYELEEDVEVIPDRKVSEAWIKALKEISEVSGEKGEVSLFHELLQMDGVLKLIKNRDTDWYRKRIDPLLSEAGEQFLDARKREGEKTLEDIKKNLKLLIEKLTLIKSKIGELESRLHDNLLERFKELTEGAFDQNRILSEVAILLMKYGISEEISRLEAHFDHFSDLSTNPGPLGKKLDFLSQEINREVNTIGSKNTMVEIAHAVVEMKDSGENIREQLRNVE